MEPLLEINNLNKSYGSFVALDSINLNIYPGEIFALLGPNGAGKTTLIGCICGLIRNFDGAITVAGYDVRKDSQVTRQIIGLVPQELNFDPFFSVENLLLYHGGLWGIGFKAKQRENLLKRFSLFEKAGANSRWLSGGMKRRLMICKSLMHQPPLLFLDEPTAGVDVELREELWDYVRQLRAEGTTVVLTTHYLEEAEQLADRIGIINEGKLLLVERRDELLREHGKRWLEIKFDQEPPDGLLERLGSFSPERMSALRLRLEFDESLAEEESGISVIQQVIDVTEKYSLKIRSVDGGRSKLEDIFKGILKGNNEMKSGGQDGD